MSLTQPSSIFERLAGVRSASLRGGVITVAIILLISVISLLPVESTAASPESRDPQHKLVEVILHEAQSSAPEFAADATLRVLELRPGAETRPDFIRMIHQALSLSSSGQEPVPLQQILGGTDSVSGSMRTAYSLGLDRLSLRARSMILLATIDPESTRSMIEQLAIPKRQPLKCSDEIMPDFGNLYARVGDVILRVYRGSTLHDALLTTLKRRVQSVDRVELVAPTVDLMLSLTQAGEDRSELASLLTTQIRRLPRDPRAFEEELDSYSHAVQSLIIQLPHATSEGLLSATRDFFLSQLGSGRCPDYIRGQPDVARTLNSFNKKLLPFVGNTEVASITQGEIRGGETASERDGDRFWKSAESRRLRDWVYLVHLRTDEESKRLPQWQRQAEMVLDSINTWNGGSEPSRSLFYLEKASLLELMIEAPVSPLLPKETSREAFRQFLADYSRRPNFGGRPKAIRTLIEFFDGPVGDAVYSRRRLEWFGPVSTVIRRADKADRPLIIESLRRARNPTLRLQGDLMDLDSVN